MSACPDKLLLLHGLADGELDAANTLSVEAHLKGCADCRAELAQIETMRAMLTKRTLAYPAPQGLHGRIDAALDLAAAAMPAPRGSQFNSAGSLASHVWNRRWASGALTGIAASFALILALPQLTHTGTEDQLVGSHVRSLMAGHLTDIATSNRHVVKPWFNGRIDFAPPVPELADEGFPLVGGRLDYIDDHTVAAVVYRRRLHTINLFVRPAGTLSLPIGITKRLDGYSLVRWTKGGLEYWAVSDIDPGELQLFRQIFVSRAVQ